MKLPAGSLGQGSAKRVSHIVLNFFNTGYAKIGSESGSLDEVIFRETTDSMDAPPPLFTGSKKLNFKGGYEDNGDIIIESDKPMPLTVLSITALVGAS